MNRFIRTVTPDQRREDEDYFPLSASVVKAVEKETLPLLQAQHLEPPHQTASNIFFPSKGESTIRASASRIASVAGSHKKVHQAPHHFRSQAIYKNFSKGDHDFALGFRDFAPSSFTGNQTWDNVHLIEHPSWEKTCFNENPGPLEQGQHPPDPSQFEGREFLSRNTDCRVKFSGCTERRNKRLRGCYCCHNVRENAYTRNNEARQKHENSEIHCKTLCPANIHLHSSLLGLDLNAHSADGHALTHLILYRPVEPKDLEEQLLHTFYKEGRRLAIKYVPEHHRDDRISELELGFLEPDSSLQMSLSRYQLQSMESHPHPFFRDSQLYKDQVEKFKENRGAIGPPPGNPSQNLLMGLWTRKQINRGLWQDRRPIARPFQDPRKKRKE